jgi:O-antigen ligase/tetratricopeptide (TPR) repeat protein
MKDIAKGIVFLGIFAIPFIPLIISNSLFFPFITGKNFTFRIIAEVVFAAWIILACYEPSYRPKRSWLLGSFSVLLVVMFFANWFGESRSTAFWSNFERMEGYFALLHTWMYFLVAGSVLTTGKLWNRFFNVTFASSLILTLYAFAQLSGNITINQGGWRLDGTLGNSAYMAVYMLFNVFLALLMLVRTDSKNLRYVYAALTALFVYLLIQTATRGTILGLVGGLGVTATYIALFSKDHPKVRKVAGGGLLAVVLIVGLFITFRESAFIQNNPYLGRVANITLSEGNVRFKVWNMALEGFQERPLLGWGQSGFSTVFNKNYDPSIYFAESWYDRVHNIFFDWLIAGGILGFVAYFAIFFSALYYLFLRPLMKHDEAFTVAERGVLIGLLIGYLFHNIFVFDNIVSYIYYGTILAFIHSRIGTPWPQLEKWKSDTRVTEQIVTPVVAVALVLTLYFVNVPGIKAAGDIIDAFRATDPEAMMKTFETALSRNSFGNQEIREQMTRRAQEVIFNQDVPQATKDTIIAKVEAELLKQIEEKPGDARAHVFIASFYRSLGTPESLEKAVVQLERARELSPKKQQIIFEQGLAELQRQNFERSYEFFKEAYELDTTYKDARVFYAMSGVATGRYNLVDEVIVADDVKDMFYTNDLVVQVVYNAKQYPLLRTIFEYRIEKNPTDSQLRTNLAYIVNESGDTAGAIEVLKKAGEDIPEFKAQAEQFMTDIVKQNLSVPQN